MFVIVPVFNATTSTSEDHTINPSLIRDIAPHADVTVGETVTVCVEAFFDGSQSLVILLDMATLNTRLRAVTGNIDTFGNPT